MQKFNGSLVRQFPSLITGNAAAGVSVTVYAGATGTNLATLFSGNGTGSLSNPLTTDSAGYYGFYAADGVYRLKFGFPNVPDQLIQLVDVNEIRQDFNALEASNEQFKSEQEAAYNSFVISQGWDQVGTFAAGFTFASPNQVGQDADGNWWRWNGALPKVVTAGTLPSSDVNYKLVGDGVLRSDLAAPDSDVLVGGVAAGELVDRVTQSEVSISGVPSLINSEISNHNLDALSHPALSSFISAEADRAEIAADNAFINADVFATVPAGITGTSVGEQFVVIDGRLANRYRHDTGGFAVLIATYPTAIDVTANTRSVFGVIEKTKNLFDKDDPDVVTGFFVNHTTGALNANADYRTSGFIPISGGQQHFIAPKNFMAWYNQGKQFISGSSNADSNNVQTAPAGAAFLRISIQISAGQSFNTAYVAVGNAPLAAYEPYGGKLANDDRRIPDGYVSPPKTDFLVKGKNLFDKAARTLDSFQGTAGVGTNTSFDLSDFIPVKEGETYQYRSAAGGARFRACFNAAGQNVSAQSNNNESDSYTVPIGSGVVSMRLTVAKARVDDFQCEEAAAPTGFEPFGFKFTDSIIGGQGSLTKSTWADKKWISYGDSLTAQQQWQPKIASRLGLLHTAQGVGGRTLSGATGMVAQANVDGIPTDTQLLTVLGGTNDWAQSVPLGSVDSTDITTFYGGLNVLAQRLTTRLPTCRIVMLTTPYSELQQRVVDGIWPTKEVNLLGFTTRVYADAVKVAAARWGFPLANLDECGWNEFNILTYTFADGGSIHPNGVGGDRVAEVVLGKLKSIEPLT